MKIRINRILCPVDFSENADHALQYALAFAEAQGAELQLLHVVENPTKSYEALLESSECLSLLAGLQNKCREHIKRIADEVGARYSKVTYHLASGTPFLEILRMAKTNDVDLIVIGTHGKTNEPHALMGGVAAKVVLKANCPVLTIRHPQHEFVMP